MTDDLGTQGDPTEGQQTEQVEAQAESAPNPDQGHSEEDRLATLEKQYKDLQRDYTRKSQQLKQIADQQQQQGTREPSIGAEDFWQDPASATAKVVQSTLSEFEQRQEQRRQAEQYLQSFAEDRDIPVRELQRLHQQLQEANGDPEAMLDMLATIHNAQNASEQITKAKDTIAETAKTNARAVTVEGGSPSEQETGELSMEDFKTWPREKRAAYLAQKYGVNDFGA